MALTRKERRYIAAERKAKGLPAMRPHGYRYLNLDAELAARYGVPLETVRAIIGQTLRVLTTGRSESGSNCGRIEAEKVGDQAGRGDH